MYRYHYRNKNSGATVLSHQELNREELELVRRLPVETGARTTQITKNETIIKPVTYKKPKVTKTKRRKRRTKKKK
jgi:hypothetical protein